MPPREITPAMLKTAWKMIDTIFAGHGCGSEDRNQMLNLTVIVSLHDLLDDRLHWASPPRPGSLEFRGRSVVFRENGGPLRARLLDHEVDEAYEQAEGLFDRYQLDEDERDTLFTALPCVGLKALEARLRWTENPPFPEVRK